MSFQYGYDPFGRRIKLQTSTGTLNYLYDGDNRVADQLVGGALRFFVTGLGVDEYFLRSDENGLNAILTDALHGQRVRFF